MKEIIIAVFASGTLFTFIQFLINRFDTRRGIEKKLDSLDERLDRDRAIDARNHILRFADEIRNGTHHSEDYFKQMLLDCDIYERYCFEHPNFSNGLTVMAAELIKEKFREIYRGGNTNEKD